MTNAPTRNVTIRDRVVNAAALLALLAVGALALIGPSGLLAWSEDASRLEQYQLRIAHLQVEGAALRNRVALMNPDQVDPDILSELLRENLNVVHHDEYVIDLDTAQ